MILNGREADAVSPVSEHYRRLLASRYTWTFGEPFEAKVEEQKAILHAAGFRPPGIAVDLGCGSGFQTMALVELGADCVYAIDSSEVLLAELDRRRSDRPITLLQGDLKNFQRIVGQPVNAIVCMGDTLTHLASENQVAELFVEVAEALMPGGLLILSWRDLSQLTSPAQLIPVKSTDERIMLCCLEDSGSSVVVHDAVYERKPNGWTFQTSSYAKIKLAVPKIKQMLQAANLAHEYETVVRGMTVVAARRRP